MYNIVTDTNKKMEMVFVCLFFFRATTDQRMYIVFDIFVIGGTASDSVHIGRTRKKKEECSEAKIHGLEAASETYYINKCCRTYSHINQYRILRGGCFFFLIIILLLSESVSLPWGF